MYEREAKGLMGRKVISLLLGCVLMASTASLPVNAQVESSELQVMPIMEDAFIKTESASGIRADKEATDKALEAAISAVKDKIKIPKEYSEFNYSYYGSNSYSEVYWSLNWRKPEDYSYIDVSLDRDFNFINYTNYGYSNPNRGIPSYMKEELEDEARDFIKQIAPDIYRKLEFREANYNGIYSNSYSYHYNRKENNIMFPDNTVTVRVDAATGRVISASIDWLRGAKIPSSSVKLSKEEAAKLMGDSLNMKLAYKTNYYRTFVNGQNVYLKKAFLVYEPDISYISIDANTSEVYLSRSEWVEMAFDNMNESASEMDASGGSDAGVFTEEEIAKIRELEKLITKDKAIEIVSDNPYLYIDDHLLTYTATLNKSYTFTDKDSSYVWNITLRDNRPIDYNKDEDHYRAYARATVDAQNGKILNFNANLKNNYDRNSGKWLPVEIKYNRAQGQDILEKFLNSQVKSRFAKTKLAYEGDDYVAYYNDENTPIYGGYSYRYNRYNEGVEFAYNSINGSVDGVTGKIYNYNSNWDDDIIFESPKNAMTAKEAFNHYISKDGFNLLYEINVINQYDPNYKSKDPYYDYSEAYSVEYEIRLVYRPDIYPQYISPFTGLQLDGSGQVYKGAETYIYKDIDNSPENREILLLADMNIGFEGDYFNPDQMITEGEVSQLLERLGYWTEDGEKAKVSSRLITREELAHNFILRLGLERIAKISGIYRTGYKDESSINTKYVGAVALAKGLEIFPHDDNESFNPKAYISRRDVVHLLFNFIKVDRD